MTRTRARKWLFVSIAITVALFILREPLADWAYSVVAGLEGGTYFESSWASAASNFFYNRWGLAISAMVAIYFGYRFATAENSN